MQSYTHACYSAIQNQIVKVYAAHYIMATEEQPCRFTINWQLSIFKAAVAKSHARC